MQNEHAAMQDQLTQAEARARAAEARCLELEGLESPQQQRKQELTAAFGSVLAQVHMQISLVLYPICLWLLCNLPILQEWQLSYRHGGLTLTLIAHVFNS